MITTFDKFMRDPKFRAAYAQESLVQNVQEAFAVVMQERNISRKQPHA